jgi:predicted component of type VI protein secretion system
VEETLGHIHVTSGPRQGEAFAVGASPVSIGAGHRCRILLKDESGAGEIASEHARVWIREGHLMVHEVRRLTDTGSIGGTWEILQPGDTFSIGPYTFQFVLGDEQSAEPPSQDAAAAIEPPSVVKETPKPAAVAATEPPKVAGEAPAPAAAATEPVNIFREKTERAPVASSEPLPAQAPPNAGEIPNIFKNPPAQQDAPEKNGAPASDAPSDAGQSSAAL